MTDKPLKQYVLIIDELNMPFFSRVMPNLRFVEVEGMAVADSVTHQLLATPIPKPPEVVEPVVEPIVEPISDIA